MSKKPFIFVDKALEWLNIPSVRRKKFLFHLGIVFLAAIAILVIEQRSFSPILIEGKAAPETIRSPKAISFVDEAKTNELRQAEMTRIQPVYALREQKPEEDMLERFDRNFEALTRFYDEFLALPPTQSPQALIDAYTEGDFFLEEEKLLQLKNLKPGQLERLRTAARYILSTFSQVPIAKTNIEKIQNDAYKHVESLPETVLLKSFLASIVRSSITTNAEEQVEQTRKKREAAASAVQPVKRSFYKGQKIIEEGTIVTAEDEYLIGKICEQIQKNKVLSIFGYSILTALLLAMLLVFLRLENKSILADPEQYKLIGTLLLLSLALSKIVFTFTSGSDKDFMAVLLSPLPSVALLLSILLEGAVVIFNILIIGIMLLVIAETNVRLIMVTVIGAIAGALAWRFANRGTDMRNLVGAAGVKIGLVNAVGVLAFIFLDGENFSLMEMGQVALYVSYGFFNGILSGIVANGVLPYMERFFSLATTTRLYELADLSHPLLKKLAEEAPGTYQHSVATAVLAEAAAVAVDADPLLTKIGAYFHDIGKIRRPMYFAENLAEGENKHDAVNPFMSSLILIGHIRDSLDLGREYNLPERVLGIMSQHHGTTLISYFYEEAKKKDGEELVSKERFRYPGPKPQTKEAAILMLADSVEAASRTLSQHTHSKIEALVNKIVEHKLNDENQLDESNLTLKDIETIEQVFVKSLFSMYHGRIDYPGKLSNAEKEPVADESSN